MVWSESIITKCVVALALLLAITVLGLPNFSGRCSTLSADVQLYLFTEFGFSGNQVCIN